MSQMDELLKEIEETKKILAESRKNYKEHPGEYSAQLLLLSTENHLADLLRKLDELKGRGEA